MLFPFAEREENKKIKRIQMTMPLNATAKKVEDYDSRDVFKAINRAWNNTC